MTDKKMNTVELTDEELESVQGGYNLYAKDGNYYAYMRRDTEDLRYLCPNCGRPLHAGKGWRFYCDPCDESWFFEGNLPANLDGGGWTPIDKERYDYYSKFGS